MQEMTTTANLVEYGTLGSGGAIAAVLSRSELEAVQRSNESAEIWFELGRGENEEMTRLTLELTIADLEEMLRVSSGDEVIVALDADAVEGLFDPPDVEAHGMRGALAIAVATAAFAAPAGLAATPQAVGTASAPQVSSQVSSQVTPAVESQVSSQVTPAATTQVSRAIARGQVKGQAKTQISKVQVAKAAGITILRSGLAK